jgi:hypothetical protein
MKITLFYLSILTLVVSCNCNHQKPKSEKEEADPNQFVLFGDLLYNQKEEVPRESAYIYKEYQFQGSTFKLNLSPSYSDGLLKSLYCSTFMDPINYSSFNKFLSLNFTQCQMGSYYGNLPVSTQPKINEIITLNSQLIEIEKQTHEFRKSTENSYLGSEEFLSNQVKIASLMLQSVYISFDGKSVIDLKVPCYANSSYESLVVESMKCQSFEDWIANKKSSVTTAQAQYYYTRKNYGF